MISLMAWKGKRTEDDGNWKARGEPAGLQHPTAKSSDKSRGNLAGSRGKCGFTTQHGTGGQKVLCDSKKKSRGQPRWRSWDTALQQWNFGSKGHHSDHRRAGRTAAPVGLLVQAHTETASHNFS